MSNLRRLLGYVGHHKGKIAAGALFTAGMGGVEVLTGVIFKVLLDIIPQLATDESVHLKLKIPLKKLGLKNIKLVDSLLDGADAIFKGLALLCLFFIVLYALQEAFRYFRDVFFDSAMQRVLQRFKRDICAKIMKLPMSFYDRNKAGDVLSRVTYDTTVLDRVINLFVELARALLYVLIFVPVLMLINWRAALLTLIALPLCYAVVRWLSTYIRSASKKATDNVGDYTAFLEMRINEMSAVRTLGTGDREIRAFDRLVEDNYQYNLRMIKFTRALKPLSEIIGMMGITLVGVYLIHRLVYGDGGSTLGDVGFFLFIAKSAWKPVKKVADSVGKLHVALVSSKKIFTLLDYPVPDVAKEDGGGGGEALETFAMEQVDFGYQDDSPIINGLDLQLKAGEILAVDGASGAGKTTLLRLIAGFYQPSAGKIVINGADVSGMGDSARNALVSLVSPETGLLEDTVNGNIGYAATPDSTLLSQQLMQAVGEDLHANRGHGSRQLSSGQRELVKLVRALAGKPQLLLLDETFNGMDAPMRDLAMQLISDVPVVIIVSRDLEVHALAHRVVTIPTR